MQARIIDLTLDDLESERSSPEVHLSLYPIRLSSLPVHALVFSAYPHAANELYPLLIDAYVAGLQTACCPSYQVVGVHEQWLCDGGFRRAILFTEEDQGLLEANIDNHPRIRSAQVLALDLAEEHAAHRRIESRLPGIPLLNPSGGAARLDDKIWTGRCWQLAGLATPAFAVLRPNDDWRTTMQHFAGGRKTLVVKPVDGTEGRQVAVLREGEWPSQVAEPLLAMADCDTVRYHAGNLPVRCTVRLNVCWDGSAAQVESGYAQVAGERDGIASAGRGGRIISLAELWSGLCRADGTSITPEPADWMRLLDTARDGATALATALGATMPALTGLDLLLDADVHDRLQPILLEANPRPSGMCHSRFVADDGPGDEPGVSGKLWHHIRNNLSRIMASSG